MKFTATYVGWLALAGAGIVSGAQATEIEEEHVLVTVPMHRQSSQNALPITVISDQELRDKAGATLGDSLSMQAGLNNASFGPAVGRPVIRGQQGARVTVLQNSTSVADASTVSPDHAIASEPVLAEGIEVLRGPSTLLYGGGAIGGVVNVLDQRIPQESHSLKGRAELRHGSVNDESTAVGKISGGKDAWMFYLDGLYRESNAVNIPGYAVREEHHEDETEEEHEAHEGNFGIIENTDARTHSATFGSSYVFAKGYFGFAVNTLDSDYGIPPGSHAHEEGDAGGEEDEHEDENIRIDLQQTRYDLRGDWHDISENVEHLRWFLTYTDYAHTEYAVHAEHEEEHEGEVGSEAEEHHGTTFSNRTLENRLELVHKDWQGWHGAMGLQVKNKRFAAKGDEAFIPDVEVDSTGIFILEDYHANFGLVEFGVRLDHDRLALRELTEESSFTNLSYSGSILRELSPAFNLGLALSHAQRSPTVEELYSNVQQSSGTYIVHGATQAIEVGNASLDKESSRNLDLSLNYQSGARQGFITLFYNDFADYIYLHNTQTLQDDWLVYQFQQRDAEFYGVEMEYQHHWSNLDVRVFGDSIRGQLASGEDLPRLPPARVGMELSGFVSRVRAFVSVVHATEQDRPGENETPSAAYTRWDAGLETQVMEEGLIFVKVKNATDEEIRESTSFLRDIAPAAGRSIEAGMRISF